MMWVLDAMLQTFVGLLGIAVALFVLSFFLELVGGWRR